MEAELQVGEKLRKGTLAFPFGILVFFPVIEVIHSTGDLVSYV